MRLLVAIVLCALLGAAALPVAADVYDSTLAGPLGSVPVHAEAIYSQGLWQYTYVVNIAGLSRNATGFSIGNIDRLEYNAANNNRDLTNPVYFAGTDSILWTAGNVSPSAETITFSFESVYGPTLTACTLWGGAFPAVGTTLGMVPEPSSLFGLAMTSLVAVGFNIRRRTRQ